MKSFYTIKNILALLNEVEKKKEGTREFKRFGTNTSKFQVTIIREEDRFLLTIDQGPAVDCLTEGAIIEKCNKESLRVN